MTIMTIKKKTTKLLSLLLCLLMVLCLVPSFTSRTYAASSRQIVLSLKKNLTKYDLTGNGKKDKLRIDADYTDFDGLSIIKSLTVSINQKVVLKRSFSDNEDPVFDVKGTLIRLKEGNCFLFFETCSMGKSQPLNALYQIKNDGSLKNVIDADTLWQEKYGDDCYFSIDEVKSKKILITTGCMNYRVGCFSMTLEYNLSNGKLKRNSSYSTNFSFAPPDGIAPRSNTFTLASSIDAYKESSLETKSFKLKKNDMVMIMQVKLSSGKLYMKVMRAGDGKKGWISCNKTKPYTNGSPLFLETFYLD